MDVTYPVCTLPNLLDLDVLCQRTGVFRTFLWLRVSPIRWAATNQVNFFNLLTYL